MARPHLHRPRRYNLARDDSTGSDAIRCKLCGRISYHHYGYFAALRRVYLISTPFHSDTLPKLR
jgi:hypothetical protein